MGQVIVVFEFVPTNEGKARYFELVEKLKPLLEGVEGFLGGERFQSLADPAKLLSISMWAGAKEAAEWRNQTEHRLAQMEGKEKLFRSYKITVAQVIRTYSGADQT